MSPRLEVDVYEVEYSCSPGGVDCWEANIWIENQQEPEWYGEFDTAGEAVNFVLDKYPTSEIQFIIKSLQWYYANEELNDN